MVAPHLGSCPGVTRRQLETDKEKKMPAVGGGPSPDQWKRMSKKEKIIYWLFVGAALVFVGYLIVEKILS